jgi:tetratricopeptide (TPR) repeat protein
MFFLCAVASASAQLKNIDSLKKVLPSLHDSARIDCLNEIVFYYLSLHNVDSINHYLVPAYEESKKINYVHGIALSLSQKAGIVMDYGNNPYTQKTITESLQWYQQTNNKKYIEIPFYQLGREFFGGSKWNEAIINLKQCFYWAKKSNEYHRMLGAISLIGEVYRESSKYDSAFEAFKQELQMAEQYKDTVRIEGALCNIGDLYAAIEDYPTAIMYYTKGFKIIKPQDLTIWDYTIHAELFSLNHQYDSALHYYNFIDSAKINIQFLPVFLVSKGEYFLLRHEYKVALDYFLKGLSYYRQLNSVNQIKRALLDVAKAYAGENKNDSVLKYAQQGLNIALQTNSRQYIRDAYQILYSVYNNLHKTDSTYFYYQKYIEMKDLVLSDQVKGKFAVYSYEQRIALLDKEEQLQQQQLAQSAEQKIFLIIGIIGVILLGIIVLSFTVLKHENERHLREIAENELQLQKLENEKQLTELEMQALRSQMNPHFIFNCLSSINSFILKNKTEDASKYLTKFSRLIRMVLNNSKESLISMEDELETLRLYLDMEKLRFKNSFDYALNLHDTIEVENIFVPPLLLEPFAENAIWHGLMHKKEKGFLSFDFCIEEKYLTCVITDNGIGRAQAELLKSKSSEKQKSMGLKITAERLSLLNNQSGKQTFFYVEDMKDENGHVSGTRVHLKISYKTLSEV